MTADLAQSKEQRSRPWGELITVEVSIFHGATLASLGRGDSPTSTLLCMLFIHSISLAGYLFLVHGRWSKFFHFGSIRVSAISLTLGIMLGSFGMWMIVLVTLASYSEWSKFASLDLYGIAWFNFLYFVSVAICSGVVFKVVASRRGRLLGHTMAIAMVMLVSTAVGLLESWAAMPTAVILVAMVLVSRRVWAPRGS